MTKLNFVPIVCGLLVYAFWGTAVSARNVDLATVPKRATVQLTIYNSEDLTLVRETRSVSFKGGHNTLQFSWANTLIDPTSVEVRFLEQKDRLRVLDTTFPHDKPHMLYWHVDSEYDGEAVIEISYFTSGITWSADYVMISDPLEKHMSFEGFVRVFNNSGEEYRDAQVRLVVGTINLVEKVAQLARVEMDEVLEMDAPRKRELVQYAAKSVMASSGRSGAGMLDEKQIIKEGLSEYFIYTIEGTETIPNGWSKRLRSLHGEAIPFAIEYRFRPREYGEQLVRMYLLKNDSASGLGSTPLPDGTVRAFRDNGRGGVSYLGWQAIEYVPVGDRIELNLGSDPRVVFELLKLRAKRDNLWLKLSGTNVYRKVEDGQIRVDAKAKVAGWDQHSVYTQRIRNYTGDPIKVNVRRTFYGDVEFRSQHDARVHDVHTVEFQAELDPSERSDFIFEVVTREGRNTKQNRVRVTRAPVPRPAPI